MQAFEALCPSGPLWTVDWAAIHETFAWVRRLYGVPQDSVHHAEGDVATHTRMAAEALTSLDEWRALPAARRVRLFAAVLLHDVAKPDCFTYFRTPGRDPRYAAYDDTRCMMTVLSGLPGAGKDTWVAAHAGDLPVISLDAIRSRLKIAPTGDQRAVASAAHEEAKKYLRSGQSFVWNATNVTRQQRDVCTGLAASYRARVEIVSLEAPYGTLLSRNASRLSPVPSAVIARLAAKWEAPDLTEAHTIATVTSG